MGRAGGAGARRAVQSARVGGSRKSTLSRIPVPRSLVKHLERAATSAQQWRDEAAEDAARQHAEQVMEAEAKRRVLVAERELAAIYEVCCPDKLHNVPTLVQRHKADLEGLLEKVLAKYNAVWAVPPPVEEQDDVGTLREESGESDDDSDDDGTPRWRKLTEADACSSAENSDEDDGGGVRGGGAGGAAPVPARVVGGGGNTLPLAEQKAALGRLLERKRKNDLAGMLQAQRAGTDALMVYLAADMVQMGITRDAFNNGDSGKLAPAPEPNPALARSLNVTVASTGPMGMPPPPPPPMPPPQRVRRASEALESAMYNRANAIEAMNGRGRGQFFFVLRTVGGAHCELGAMSCEACLRAAADKRVRLCKCFLAPTGLSKPRIQAREHAEAELQMYEYDPVLAFESQQAADAFVREQALALAHDD